MHNDPTRLLKLRRLSILSVGGDLEHFMILFIWNSCKGESLITDQWLPRASVGEDGRSQGIKTFFIVMELFYVLIVVMATQLYTIAKIHQTGHFKGGRVILYKL
jgi:hypothetical protein